MNLITKKSILAVGSCSFNAPAAIALHGRSCNNFVVFRADVFGTIPELRNILRI